MSDGRRLGRWIALELATLTAGTANSAMAVALAWLPLERGAGPAAASAVAAAVALPLLISTLFSGALVDRLGRRSAATGAELVCAAAVLTVPLADRLGGLTLPVLISLTVLAAMFEQTGVIAREASVPSVAEQAGKELELVNGVHQAVWGLALVLGPAVAGVTIAVFGALGPLLVIGGLFVVSALVSLAIPRGAGSMQADEAAGPAGGARAGGQNATGQLPEATSAPRVLAEGAAGLRFVRAHPLLRVLVLLVLPMAAFCLPIEGLLLPLHFQRAGKPFQLGAVLMVISGGMICGGLGYGALAQRVRVAAVFRCSLVLVGLGAVVMAAASSFPAMLLGAAALGLAYGPIGPLVASVVQRATPDHLRGRVLAVLTAATYAAGPAGLLASGWAVTTIGLQPVFLVVALGLVVAALFTFLVPSLDQLDAAGGTGCLPPTGMQPDPADSTPLPVVTRLRRDS